MKIPSKQELQQIEFNNSSDIEFKDLKEYFRKNVKTYDNWQ